jgi:hypothetical protein
MSTNLASLGYRYHLSAPKSFSGLFRTHTDIRSVVPFRFATGEWQRLSNSGPYHRYLATNPDGSEMSFHAPASDPARRAVPPSAIVLTEYRADEKVYVAHVPRLDQRDDLGSAGKDQPEDRA